MKVINILTVTLEILVRLSQKTTNYFESLHQILINKQIKNINAKNYEK